MNDHNATAHRIVTSFVTGGKLTPARLQELAETIEKALTNAVSEENEACADIAVGCATPAIADAIRKRLNS
jgi:hypothetical protein